MDLLNELGRPDQSPERIDRTISTLEKLPHHEETGLFYSWYSTENGAPRDRSVSSIDNAHLALALWTLSKSAPNSNLKARAVDLFERMNFEVFYDRSNNLFGGNLLHKDGKWELESYRFGNFGSEARSLYALAWSLDLTKGKIDKNFPEKALRSLDAELTPDSGVLRTWDGGAFQLLLPRLLLGEETLSPTLRRSFSNYAEYILRDAQERNLPVPAAHSASSYGVDGSPDFSSVPAYVGKAGSPALVASKHRDVNAPEHRALWDSVYTPHAAFLAAGARPELLGNVLAQTESIQSSSGNLYVAGLGFMDGYHVSGPYKGQVVPVLLSLDQGMIALTLSQLRNQNGVTPSSRALQADPAVMMKLQEFYRQVDRALNSPKRLNQKNKKAG